MYNSGGTSRRVAAASLESWQPHLCMAHMIKLILDMWIADTKHVNLAPCVLFSTEIFQRIDLQKIPIQSYVILSAYDKRPN